MKTDYFGLLRKMKFTTKQFLHSSISHPKEFLKFFSARFLFLETLIHGKPSILGLFHLVSICFPILYTGRFAK